MDEKPTFPIRLKILLTLLFVVTAVVSLITYSMAGMFHEDKKTYIHDLTSLIAMSASEECRSMLQGTTERLRVYGRTMTSETLSRAQRTELMTTYFQEFRGLVALLLYENGKETASVFDTNVLEIGGLTKEAIRADFEARPLPVDQLQSAGVLVENRTLVEKLPMFVLAVPLDPTSEGAPRMITAVLQLDGLQRLSSRSDVFEIFVVDRHGVLLAHPNPALLAAPTAFPLPEGVTNLRFGAAITREFAVGDTEMIGGFASPDFGGVTAGVRIPRAAAFIASRAILSRLTTVALLLLVAAAVIGLVGSRTITRPVERLLAATEQVGRGKFDIQVQVGSRDEIGTLSNSFNEMARELDAREEALEETQKQLIQSEKMAAFGQLGAGVAHEVKNPLAGILGCTQLSLRSAEKGSRLHRNLELIEKETKRCKEIVENLLRFARQEKAVLELTDLRQVVDDSTAIVNHQLELNEVKLDVEKAESLPLVQANANQLQQVLINLIVNAQQAIGKTGGTVTVRLGCNAAGDVELSVADDGPGVPDEIQAKIFEPFFTTKPNGGGTGLGLSVSYGIVKDHNGEIRLETAPGEGAKFTMTFPAQVEMEVFRGGKRGSGANGPVRTGAAV